MRIRILVNHSLTRWRREDRRHGSHSLSDLVPLDSVHENHTYVRHVHPLYGRLAISIEVETTKNMKEQLTEW